MCPYLMREGTLSAYIMGNRRPAHYTELNKINVTDDMHVG